MRHCSGCQKGLYWFQKKSPGRTNWHFKCWASWGDGYEKAFTHCTKMNNRLSLPTPDEIYRLTNPYNSVVRANEIWRQIQKRISKLPINYDF
jgi:hypothetical protein